MVNAFLGGRTVSQGRVARLDSKFVTAGEAAKLVGTGMTIAIGASSGISAPDTVMAAIADLNEQTGAPSALTAVFPVNVGDMFGQPGLDHFARPGMLSAMIGGSYTSGPGADPPPIRALIAEGDIRAFNYPIGHLVGMLSESAARGVGFITEVGLGTFIDPRHGGGGLNEKSRNSPHVRRANLGERTVLHYPNVQVDVAIIRATSADEDGNLTFEHEAALISPFTLAACARTNGGKVIAQVKRKVAAADMDPRAVKVPGYMVDVVVIDPEQMQATRITHDPVLSGQERIEPKTLPEIDDPLAAFLSRRVASQLHQGDVAVLGFGICANVPMLLSTTGEEDKVSFVIEQGAVGGLPVNGFAFGCARNARAYLDAGMGFQYLRGGGFDVAMLSFLQIDEAGNVNVSLLPPRPHATAGVGGFMDIAHNAPSIVFGGYLRGGASDICIEENRLCVRSEGKHAKLVKLVDEVTVPGEVLRRAGRSVRIVTERCMFDLTAQGLRLIEVVPGIDPEHIRAQCTAKFTIAENLQIMPEALFRRDHQPLLRAPRHGARHGAR